MWSNTDTVDGCLYQLCHAVQIGASIAWQIAKATNLAGGTLPAGQDFVDGFTLLVNHWIRQIFQALALVAIGNTYRNLAQTIQHIQLGECQTGTAVDLADVA